MNLLDHLRPQRQRHLAQRLGVGRLFGADAGEQPIHQVGLHLALQRAVAPVADVLQHQQPQDDLGGSARAAPPAAPRPVPSECLEHWLD